MMGGNAKEGRARKRTPDFSESSDEEDFTPIPSQDKALEKQTVKSPDISEYRPTRRSRRGREAKIPAALQQVS
jgi:hypothetical protein